MTWSMNLMFVQDRKRFDLLKIFTDENQIDGADEDLSDAEENVSQDLCDEGVPPEEVTGGPVEAVVGDLAVGEVLPGGHGAAQAQGVRHEKVHTVGTDCPHQY